MRTRGFISFLLVLAAALPRLCDAQKAVPVLEDDTPETLHARIQVQEHIAFPEALNILASGRYRIEGRRVRIG